MSFSAEGFEHGISQIGRQRLKVSEIGLGCNNFGMRIDQAATDAVIDAAIEHGVTFLDTADVYGGAGKSEEMMGVALKGKRN
jgi:aryl-alcohol dehydrogenase-like predicted oxidoreductase